MGNSSTMPEYNPVTINDNNQKKYYKLSNESCKTFDKDYTDCMV
jgi:hypothetical protein